MAILEGRKVVIVGGNSGIGLATAMALASEGARVSIVGRSKKKTHEAAKEVGGTTTAIVADASDRTAMESALVRLGKVDDVIVTAAGGAGAGAIQALDTEALRQGFEEKFWVHWTVLKTVLTHIRQSGSITFVGAARSRMADPESVGLAAINGAIDAMVPGLAKGLAPIRVNMMSPGVIDTPPWDALPAAEKPQYFEQLMKNLPAGRVGRPEEVASAITAIIQNEYITGVILEVDGGMRL